MGLRASPHHRRPEVYTPCPLSCFFVVLPMGWRGAGYLPWLGVGLGSPLCCMARIPTLCSPPWSGAPDSTGSLPDPLSPAPPRSKPLLWAPARLLLPKLLVKAWQKTKPDCTCWKPKQSGAIITQPAKATCPPFSPTTLSQPPAKVQVLFSPFQSQAKQTIRVKPLTVGYNKHADRSLTLVAHQQL